MGSKQKDYGFCLRGFQIDCTGECSAGIFIVTDDVSKTAGCDALRIAISMIFSKEILFISAVGRYVGARKAEKALR